jgi:signal peptidase I
MSRSHRTPLGVVFSRVKLVTSLGVAVILGAIIMTIVLTGCGSTSREALASHAVNTVSDSPCVVPSLKGEPLLLARRVLDTAHCKLGTVTVASKQRVLYIVTAQSVEAGTRLPKASPVNLQLAPAPAGLVTYRVSSGGMEPTFRVGTTVWVQTQDFSPTVGDVVVFHPPNGAAQELCGPVPHTVKLGGAACDHPVPHPASVRLIKRIVAGPGDVVSIRDGRIIRNGKREHDSYIRQCGSSLECNFPTPIEIPPGHWFMMGDNRGESDDSRFWGPIPTDWIIGHVIYCTAVGRPCPERSR